MKTALYIITGILCFLALIFVLEYYNFMSYQFFGVHRANVNRQIYEQSQSYVMGKKQELNKMMLEFKTSNDEISRKAIKNLVAHNFAEFNEDDADYNLTNEEKTFLKDMKYGTEIDTVKYPYLQN